MTPGAIFRHPIHGIRIGLKAIERCPVSPASGVLSFLALVFIRYQLEMMLESRTAITMHPDFYQSFSDLIHVYICWLTVYLIVVGSYSLAGRVAWAKSTRLGLILFPVILLPPIIDGLCGTGGGINYQADFQELITSFLLLFNPNHSVSYVTPGVRIEILAATILPAVYFLISDEPFRFVKAVVVPLLIYLGVFVIGFLPAIWGVATGGHGAEWVDVSQLGVTPIQKGFLWYLPMALPLLVLWLGHLNRSIWLAIQSCLRPTRLIFYLGLFALGVWQAAPTSMVKLSYFNVYDTMILITAMLSIGSAFISQVALNDVHDVAIDRVTNPNRPLVSQGAEVSDHMLVAVGFGLLGLLLAFVVNPVMPYPVGFMLALGYLYSAPPFRLRKYFLVAPLVLTSIAVSAYLSGYVLIHQNMAITYLSNEVVAIICVFFFFGCQLKDIKDVNGDKKNGVTTLFTLLGVKTSLLILATILNVVAVFIFYKFNLSVALGAGLILFDLALALFWRKSGPLFLILFVGLFFVLLNI